EDALAVGRDVVESPVEAPGRESLRRARGEIERIDLSCAANIRSEEEARRIGRPAELLGREVEPFRDLLELSARSIEEEDPIAVRLEAGALHGVERDDAPVRRI